MKLVEILAKKLDAWPTGAAIAVQDGDARKTVKFGGKHANPSIALMGMEDVWQARDWKFTHESDFDHSVLASDWKTAIVTEKKWQAERDRQKGGEWKRHRGGKCPVPDQTQVEVKFRDGDIRQSHASDFFGWNHGELDDTRAEVMQYRVISQPQAEHTDWVGPFPCTTSDSTVNEIELAISYSSGVCSLESKTEQMETPFKWRDEVTELNAYIEEFTRERDSLIERLASEGFALIPPVVSVVSEFSGVDMSDWRNWKAGDIVTSLKNYSNQFSIGSEYEIENIENEILEMVADDVGDPNGWDVENFKFIRSP